MFIIDSHCHLDDARFVDDFDEVLERATAAGVQQFVVPAVARERWPRLQRLAQQYDCIRPAYGLHPWFCDRPHVDEDVSALAEWIANADAVAIGECGIDLMPNRPPLEMQLPPFQAQLRLAAARGLPVIIHAVRSADLVAREIRDVPDLRGVIHGFNGSLQQAERLVSLGMHIGIGSLITYERNQRLHEVARYLPLESLLLETDAPDQPGATHRGERNEPAYLPETAVCLARLRKQEPETIIEACNHNAKELFKL
jgi:TatD DNase family protein